ncbi:MAG: permease [Chloroflexi bacterium]|nr:permease [Chloroflexota bacterium]
MSSIVMTSPRAAKRRVWLAAMVFTVLFTLLFQYRILSLLNKLGGNFTPIGTRLPISFDLQNAPQWLLPFYYTADYLNTVWFTTLLGLFVAGGAITFLPDFVHRRLRGDGLQEHLSAVLLGIPNMLCTCCAATTLPGLRRLGVGLGASLAFFVTAPSLNIVVILLAFQLLPLPLAIARSVLGLVAAVGVTYVLAKLYPAVESTHYETACTTPEERTIGGQMWSLLSNTWDVARVAIPLLVVGIVIVSVLKAVVPVELVVKNLGDGLPAILLASAIGTFLMVPTFTEVLWVGEFTKQGMSIGPAVALLATLPAVSLPSLWVLGKVFRSYRMAASLGVVIFVLGAVSGVVVAAV